MSPSVTLRRAARIPDPVRVERCLRAPELGPHLLFLSGGSALRDVARVLKSYTYNSSHLVTPFDSGGSSAALRQAFEMLSVGDLRNRLMALADESLHGNPEIYALFTSRLAADARASDLVAELDSMVAGRHPLVARIPQPLQRIVRTYLRMFREHMPPDFELRGASVGNLVIAAGYLNNERDIESVIYLFSKLVEVRGWVRPVVDAHLHLAADLDDGTRIVGQHLITGKVEPPIQSPIRELELVHALEQGRRAHVRIEEPVRRRIREADVICYPMGSLYTSVIANLLPSGVGDAIADANCPKVFVPNTGHDPEQLGVSIAGAAETLVRFGRRDVGEEARPSAFLNFVLVDLRNADYREVGDLARLKELGIDVVDLDLVTPESAPHIDPQLLTEALVSLA